MSLFDTCLVAAIVFLFIGQSATWKFLTAEMESLKKQLSDLVGSMPRIDQLRMKRRALESKLEAARRTESALHDDADRPRQKQEASIEQTADEYRELIRKLDIEIEEELKKGLVD